MKKLFGGKFFVGSSWHGQAVISDCKNCSVGLQDGLVQVGQSGIFIEPQDVLSQSLYRPSHFGGMSSNGFTLFSTSPPFTKSRQTESSLRVGVAYGTLTLP